MDLGEQHPHIRDILLAYMFGGILRGVPAVVQKLLQKLLQSGSEGDVEGMVKTLQLTDVIH